MQKHLPVILFFLASAQSWGYSPFWQQDSLKKVLQPVIISTFGKRSINGTSLTDSLNILAPQNASLSRILSGSGRLYLREYSPGGIGSISIRGGNAAQTAVLWEGLNIQNNMIGQTDPSLIASELFSSVILEPQSSSANWGSGPVAGAIHLMQQDTGSWLRAQALYNSFGGTRHALNTQIRKKRLRQRAGLLYEKSRNRFSYLSKGGELQREEHAASQGIHAIYNADLQTAEHMIYLKTWAAKVHREIPPTLDMPGSDAVQSDAFLRVQSGIKKYYHKFGYDIRLAGFLENLRYRDTLSGILSNGTSRILHADAETHYRKSDRLFFIAGFGYQYLNASISEYQTKPRLNRLQSYLQAKWNPTEALSIHPSYRVEWLSHYRLIHLPQVEIITSLLPRLQLKISTGKTFRYPSFNDLFWKQGGNPALLPEHGMQAEASLKYRKEWTFISLQSDFGIFYRSIRNFIQWTPKGNLWQSENQSKVNLRGTEFSTTLQYHKGKQRAGISTFIGYTLAENPEISNVNAYYTQLIYVPMYQAMASVHAGLGNFTIFFQQQYTGYRYTSNDNYQFLPPFMLSNTGCSYRKIPSWLFTARVNNLFNENYQTIARRAMPLRWYELSIHYQINTP